MTATEDIPIQGGHPQQPSQARYIEIPFAEDLRDLGVTKLGKYGDMIQVHLNRGKQTFYFPVDKKEPQKTLKYFQNAAEKSGGLSPNAITEMEGYLLDPSKGYAQYLQPEKKASTFRYGYSNKDENGETINYAVAYDLGPKMYEAVKIGDANIFLEVENPLLLQVSAATTSRIAGIEEPKKSQLSKPDIKLTFEIPLPESEGGGRVLPLPTREYLSIPYEFKSKDEFDRLVAEVRQYKTAEPLYYEVKRQWMLFSKFGGDHNNLCSMDTVFTYFQDRLGLTHYLIFSGAKNSGKSTNLFLFKILAYRNIMSSNIPHADVYSLTGNCAKEGAFTLSDNEVTNLDTDDKKLQVYKDSYTKGIPNHRLDTTFGRKIQKLSGYSFKALSLENFPTGEKVEGFLQRCIPLPCKGKVQELDIVLVLNSLPGDDLYPYYEELRILRNKLLIYRMLHYFDKFPTVKLNIPNRENQLFQSLFRIFQNTKHALRDLENVATRYTIENRERTAHTLDAVIYRTIRFLTTNGNTDEINTVDIWSRLKTVLEARNIIDEYDLSFECADFGNVSLKKVATTLKEIFTAKPIRNHGANHETIRGWKIDLKALEEQNFTYNPDFNIRVAITTDNIPKIGSDVFGFQGRIKKIKKNQRGLKSRNNPTQKSQHNGSNRKPLVSKKRRQSN